MSMTVTRRKDDRAPRVLMHKVADIRGGVSVATSELGGNFLPEGALLSAPDDKGLCHVVKTASVYAAATASDKEIKVGKAHNFAVGDHVMSLVGGAAYKITAIDTSAKSYDTLTLSTALGELTKGALLFESSKSGASDAVLKFEPKAINGTGKPFRTDSNLNTDAWLIGVTHGLDLPDEVNAYLPGIINY